jgi:NAD(P)-dependent dehydrogenase (short-subunit alcohol dehydrogenase family)
MPGYTTWLEFASSSGSERRMKVRAKVIAVTGAGNGIGRELALHLLSKGARVAGIDLAPQSLEETAALAGGYAQDFAAFVADVSKRCLNRSWNGSERSMASSTMPGLFSHFAG